MHRTTAHLECKRDDYLRLCACLRHGLVQDIRGDDSRTKLNEYSMLRQALNYKKCDVKEHPQRELWYVQSNIVKKQSG
jgi:hypothetical protein